MLTSIFLQYAAPCMSQANFGVNTVFVSSVLMHLPLQMNAPTYIYRYKFPVLLSPILANGFLRWNRARKREKQLAWLLSHFVVFALTDHSSRPISSWDITHAVIFVTIWSNQRKQTAIQLFSDSILIRNSLNIYFKFVIKVCGKRRGVINTSLIRSRTSRYKC